MPQISHGWRPISAVSQPAVLAMYGNGKASISAQSSQDERSRRRRSTCRAATPMSRMKSVPNPAMMWNA